MSSTLMVICDSSTLIHLSAIGRLTLLRDLYGSLIVPSAVWREVEHLRPELDKLREEGGFWIEERLYRGALQAVGEEPAS